MITSKRAKIVLGIVFFVIGYLAISFALFLWLQVDTRYGSLGIVGAGLLVILLVWMYKKLTT